MQAFSYQVPSGVAKLPAEIKFRFSLKATKNLPIGLTLLRKRQTKCEIFQILWSYHNILTFFF